MSGIILYHYTHKNALINILKNRTIWATNFKYLKDNEQISNLCRKLKYLNPDNIYVQKIVDLSFSLQSNKGVFSLSEKGDLLSQWIHYGEFAIGFNQDKLNICLEKQGFYKLQKCIYNEDLQNKIILDSISNYDSFNIEKFLSNIGLIFKNIKHAQENEWRAISTSLAVTSSSKYDKWKIRITPSRHILEYLEINLSDCFPIEEIIVSSEKDFEKEKYSLEHIIAMNYGNDSLNNIKIKKSSIPFRKI
ncbi:MAG: DUF2971 domain-containing protein [Clostridium butyricum]|nr:DUF2971 domain-containing protein [Clostridium butyricum]